MWPYLETEILQIIQVKMTVVWDLPGGPVVKYPPHNAKDAGSIPYPGTRSHMPWSN